MHQLGHKSEKVNKSSVVFIGIRLVLIFLILSLSKLARALSWAKERNLIGGAILSIGWIFMAFNAKELQKTWLKIFISWKMDAFFLKKTVL